MPALPAPRRMKPAHSGVFVGNANAILPTTTVAGVLPYHSGGTWASPLIPWPSPLPRPPPPLRSVLVYKTERVQFLQGRSKLSRCTQHGMHDRARPPFTLITPSCDHGPATQLPLGGAKAPQHWGKEAYRAPSF